MSDLLDFTQLAAEFNALPADAASMAKRRKIIGALFELFGFEVEYGSHTITVFYETWNCDSVFEMYVDTLRVAIAARKDRS